MTTIATYTFSDITLGQTTEFSVTLTEKLVEDFSVLSGDSNPLHMDDSYAKETQFNGRIVHGQLGVCFFSRLIGMHLPGKYALYLKQSSSFRSPMQIGMEIIVRGTVSQKTEVTKTLFIETQILDKNDGSVLVDGQAVVTMLQ